MFIHFYSLTVKWYVKLAAALIPFTMIIGIVCDFIMNRRPEVRFTNDQQENSLHHDSTESTTCENTGNLHKHILPICADVKNFKDKLQMREIFVRDVTQTEE